MIGPAPIAEADVNARVQELIPALRAACQALGVPFLDVFDRLKSSSTWMQEIARRRRRASRPARRYEAHSPALGVNGLEARVNGAGSGARREANSIA